MPVKKSDPPIELGDVIDHDVNLDILTQPFPAQAIKQRTVGGGRSLSYVEGHTVIHRLNAATNYRWDMEVLDLTSMAIGPATVLRAHVRLTIPGLGSREHVGVQAIADRAGEDLVKGAVTDALKKCATLFGVGLELYGPDYGSGELDDAPAPAKPAAASKPEKGPGTQAAAIYEAGKAKGLTPEAVRDVTLAVAGNGDPGAITREKAKEVWTFLTKSGDDEIESVRSIGERERRDY